MAMETDVHPDPAPSRCRVTLLKADRLTLNFHITEELKTIFFYTPYCNIRCVADKGKEAVDQRAHTPRKGVIP